jgi:UDP-N-acetylglucosamine 1-carboxyvinyltransferase
MAKFKITGGKSLSGEIAVKGAKNAALKMIAAALIAKGNSTIRNVPDILDIQKMIKLVEGLGAMVTFKEGVLQIDTSNINSSTPNPNLVRHFRGSIVLIGPLLGRFGKLTIAQPGGCLIGARPVDTHLNALGQLGVKYKVDDDNYHIFSGDDNGGEFTVVLDQMSVTATENIIMSSVIGKKTVHLRVAACEPEIGELIDFLNKMGAKISGRDTHFLTITGVESLAPIDYTVIPDRIEAATFAIIGILTKGTITIKDIIPEHLDIFFEKLRAANANFELKHKENGLADLIIKRSTHLKSVNIDTRTYPGFPTDLQSPFAVLLTQAEGVAQIFETLYEGRFNYLKELASMGASVSIQSPHIFLISGPTPLYGKEIKSLDIRGGAAVLIAALIANGTSTIDNIELIDRGYEQIDQRLNQLGASIERI